MNVIGGRTRAIKKPDLTAAEHLTELIRTVTGVGPPIRIRAWDGTEAGRLDGPVLVIRRRRALRRLVWAPGELGLVRAYVSGELDVDGDLTDALAPGLGRGWHRADDRGVTEHPRPDRERTHRGPGWGRSAPRPAHRPARPGSPADGTPASATRPRSPITTTCRTSCTPAARRAHGVLVRVLHERRPVRWPTPSATSST